MQKKRAQRIVVIALIAGAIALAIKFNLAEKLTLDYMKASQAEFQATYESNPWLVIGIFFAVYVLTTALSLPGAAVLTLAAGALFGFLVGTIVVSFASTLGATLACISSRFLLQNWVQEKFRSQVGPINSGIENEGAFYLFTLRLVPAFPFFLINLVMGLTKMPMVTYFWVSQLGMLPGTMVYVNAGLELSKLTSLAGILSPGLIASFVALGIFPLLAKKAISFAKGRLTR